MTRRRPPGIRLSTPHRLQVYGACIAVAATGIAWFIRNDLQQVEPDALQRWLLAGHGMGGILALVAFGSILPAHARLAWQGGRNRISGSLVFGAFVIFAATAALLYYGTEDMRPWVRWTHIGTGIGAIAALPLHIVLGRRGRRRDARGPGPV